ncbi:U7 snRNA-associated Sm-like protein LSm10 [Oppia nitens]|uniref:U7 snRNA-associated Sm-like protein LSm10 n=1 Tax=Oppia nitens TaxID=1686743 RepID=UPI0023DB0F4D|nr:U7 snRNA-associated Sm-like protein LSm10 [Oppia nitens]
MTAIVSARERAKSAKTLICLLQSLIGRRTRIDLRNDNHLMGVIDGVDSFMNTELSDCTIHDMDGQLVQSFDYYFAKGSRIRMVHIPDDIDMVAAIECQLEVIQSRRKAVQQNMQRRTQSTIDKKSIDED